jgi:hypothetical protein
MWSDKTNFSKNVFIFVCYLSIQLITQLVFHLEEEQEITKNISGHKKIE